LGLAGELGYAFIQNCHVQRELFTGLKRETEKRWVSAEINPEIYGLQFQPGTRWNAGLSERLISEYECVLGARFPHDFHAFLGEMNGTDLPTLNVYGSSGHPHEKSPGVYSYPRDLDPVRKRAGDIRENWDEIVRDLGSQGFELISEARVIPVYEHRYLVCAPNLENSIMLSIAVNSVDAMVYANSLEEYLVKEFLPQGPAR
jgi:hypothetical protein